MKKHTAIAFRTSTELRSALEKIARDEGRSLSFVIEAILTDYARRNGVFSSADGRPGEQTDPAVRRTGLGLMALARHYPVEDILVALDLALKNIRNLPEILGCLIDSGAVANEREALRARERAAIEASMHDRLLRLPGVLKIVGMSGSGWLRGVKEGRYPSPIRLSRRISVWPESDIWAFVKRVKGEQGKQ